MVLSKNELQLILESIYEKKDHSLFIIMFSIYMIVFMITLTLLYWKFRITYDQALNVVLNKAILITGCDSGIGLQLAQYFYSRDFIIICGYINNEPEGYKQLKNLSSSKASSRCVHMIKLDVTLDEDIVKVTEYVSENLDSGKFELHASINDAGICIYGEFDWLTVDQIDNLFSVNIIGAIRLTKAMLEFLIKSKGRLINVSSVNDCAVFPGLSIYSATKSAMSIFSKGLSYEMRKFGVKVITVRLGDFAKLTNIMSRHECNKNEMWNNMNREKQVLYKDFFNRFHENYGMTSPKNFAQSSLFKDFVMAVSSRFSPHTITCAPTQSKIFYWLLEQVPLGFQHILLDWMFYFAFGWSPNS